MATAYANIDSITWSVETYRLDEISSHFKLPIMVRVHEGIYGDLESEKFSANDIIKLEKEVSLPKVAAHFIHDLNEWRSNTRSDYEQYVSLKAFSEILIPLRYKGKLQIVSEENICDSVVELSRANSKYFMVLKNLVIPQLKGSITLQADTMLEIDRSFPVSNGKGGNRILVCKYDMNKTQCTVELPMTMKGKFKSINDENKYTLQYIIDNFELPQAVKFVDSDIEEMYSRDIIDGVENMVHYSGIVSLNRLVMQKVLIGYYKKLDAGYADQNRFFRRPIVVLPMDSGDVKEIEVSVPQMLPEDNDIYEFVMTNNFPSDRTCDLTSVDGNLYAEFAKCPRVHILDEELPPLDEDPPPLPPKPRAHNELPPRVPQRPNKSAQVSAAIGPKVANTNGSIYDKDGYIRPLESRKDTTFIGYEDVSNVKKKEMGIPHAKGLNSTGCVKGSGRSPVPDSKKKVGGHHEMKPTVASSAKVSPTPSTETEQRIYDYPDLSKMDLLIEKRPVAHVSPQSKICPYQERSLKDFSDLTVSEVCERLKLCGFEQLIEVCKNQTLDGKFMHGLEEKLLAKSPFSLTEFHMKKFHDMVHKNWVPKLS